MFRRPICTTSAPVPASTAALICSGNTPPGIVAAEALGVAAVEHREAQRRVEPALGVEGELGVDREAGGQREAARLGDLAEAVEGRPGALGVHVVGGDGGDAAPVVDAGVEQVRRSRRTGSGGACRWISGGRISRARAMAWRKSSGGHGGGGVHRGAGLGQEVLDDHLLHVAVAAVGRGDGLEGLDAVGAVLADADEDPGGERDAELAGGLEGGQAAGRAPCRARRGGSRGRRGATRSSSPGWGRRPGGAASSSLRRGRRRWRGGAGRSRRARARPWRPGSRRWRRSRARPATRRPPGSGPRGASPRVNSASWQPAAAPAVAMASTCSGREVRRLEPGRRLGEGAVAAAVAAQHRERDEHLGREGDPPPVGLVPDGAGPRQELVERHVDEGPRVEHAGHPIRRLRHSVRLDGDGAWWRRSSGARPLRPLHRAARRRCTVTIPTGRRRCMAWERFRLDRHRNPYFEQRRRGAASSPGGLGRPVGRIAAHLGEDGAGPLRVLGVDDDAEVADGPGRGRTSAGSTSTGAAR